MLALLPTAIVASPTGEIAVAFHVLLTAPVLGLVAATPPEDFPSLGSGDMTEAELKA